MTAIRQKKPHLEFLRNSGGEEEGLGNAGIETFRDAPYASLGREHGQNSLDARAADPVRVSIDLILISMEEYPDGAALRQTIDDCLAQARDEKSRKFFNNAKKTMRSAMLKVLRVADFNTRGLRGPSVRGTPFNALIKGAGVSEDKAATSGGSFGIGKNAAFAVSDLQTVFYSTAYPGADGNREFLAQGKTVLVSHQDAAGVLRRATGYWGMNDFAPVADPRDVPEWLRRTETGTSVFAIGFREKPNWAYRVAAALLQNFFGAIHEGKLEFLVDNGRIKINRSTLGSLFADASIRAGAEQEDRQEDLDCAAAMYRCLISPEAEERSLETPQLGRTTVRVLMEDGLPKRVLLLRNGMWITDGLQHFGDKLQRFPMYRDFVAVVECHEEAGNALFKQLESPRHDSLSSERIFEDEARNSANRLMRELARQIRNAIRECAKPEPGTSVALDELAEFFDNSSISDRPPAPGGERNPEKFTYEAAKRRVSGARAGAAKGAQGGGGGGRGDSEGGKGGDGRMKGTGSGGSGDRGGRIGIPLIEPRNVMDGEDTRARIIYVTPAASGFADFNIKASGIDDSTPLKIVQTSEGKVTGDAIRLNMEEGKRLALKVMFDGPYDGPIEIEATAVQSGVAHEAE